MWVVKLGGSLHDAPALRGWLRALAGGPGPARIVVPGGGPFADTVRRLQPALGFDELAAHRMAILAMQQLGLALQSLEPAAGAGRDRCRAAGRPGLRSGCPGGSPAAPADIPASWDVTSDSLACWLAIRLGAATLVLVKSAAVPKGEHAAPGLVTTGLLDAAFPAMARRFRGRIFLQHRDADPAAALDHQPDACRVTV